MAQIPPRPSPEAQDSLVRRPWSAPRVSDLPRLSDLTLQTGSGIPGGGGDSSTVI